MHRQYIFGAVVLLCSALLLSLHPAGQQASRTDLTALVVVCIGGYIATALLIPVVGPKCLAKGLSGRDLHKHSDALIPETLGIVSGTISIICSVLLQLHHAKGQQDDPFDYYESGLLSMTLMLMLGFADDVLDLRWRIKIVLSALATLPIITAYAGPTDAALPFGLGVVELGGAYYAAIVLIVIFSTNSINVLAGVNGLEVGQSIVIAIAIAACNLAEILLDRGIATAHSVSLCIITPFITTSLALLSYNWYPSTVFIGDSYTYFAGMTIAVAGILGHFTKTLLLLLLPQLLNFALSLPQLFGFVPCPRHRLPRFNKQTDKLEAVWPDNLNLLNYTLFLLGPIPEKTLVVALLLLQTLCCSGVLCLRYIVIPHLLQG